MEKQRTYRCVCVCVCKWASVCTVSQSRWLRCWNKHLASAFWVTGGEVTAGHIWRVKRDFLFSLCLFQLLMHHGEAKVALIWPTEHSSWFCACFMVLFPVYNSCSRKPNYVMQICLELYSVLKPADTQSHNQNIVARTYNLGCCENWMELKYNSVASFEMGRISIIIYTPHQSKHLYESFCLNDCCLGTEVLHGAVRSL